MLKINVSFETNKFNLFYLFYYYDFYLKTNKTEHFGSNICKNSTFINVSVLQKLHRDFIIKDLSGKPMKAMMIFSIFIEYLTNSLLEAMNKGLDRSQIFKSDIDFVLVVPARCGDGAKMLMREAAIKVR